jgi:uncharacterized membrane protein YvbJ
LLSICDFLHIEIQKDLCYYSSEKMKIARRKKGEAMYCPNCGQENDSIARFCMACGKPISRLDSTTSAKLACSACGYINRPGIQFCEECGNSLGQPAMQTTQAATNQTVPRPIGLQIAIRLLAGGCVGFITGKLVMWVLYL